MNPNDIQKIHDRLDHINFEYGDEYNYCIFCGSNIYNGHEGILHDDDCVIKILRSELK